MRSPGPLALATLVTAVAMLTWSCAQLPTAPMATPDAEDPPFLRAPTGAATPFGSGTGSGSSASKAIDGAAGGSIEFGNFRLVVPPGAYAGVATLTITVPDPSVVRCDLSISPAQTRPFAQPVQLIADCSSATVVDVSGMKTLTFDTARGLWVVVPGSTVSSASATITTPLEQFSECGVVDGKAGW